MWAFCLALLLFQQNPLREGLEAYAKKNYSRAIELLTPAVANVKTGTPAHNEAALALGQSYFLLGRFNESIPWLEKRRQARTRPEIDYMLSQAYLQTGATDKARSVLAELFRANDNIASAHAITARMLVRLGRSKDAIAELEAAVKADPKNSETHLMLGEVALATSDAKLALRHFEAAAAINPAGPAAWLGAGEAHSRLEQWTEAIPVLQKSIWLNPHVAPPYIALGKAYLRVKSLSNAETMLRQALELDPKNATAASLLKQASRKSNN